LAAALDRDKLKWIRKWRGDVLGLLTTAPLRVAGTNDVGETLQAIGSGS
jgi:hypothetical protein